LTASNHGFHAAFRRPVHRIARIPGLALGLLLSLAPLTGLAQDSLSAREAAADRYLRVTPMSRVLDDTFAEMSKQLPPDQRQEFLRRARSAVRPQALEQITRTALIRHFTADELNALADFYGSRNGASAMKKFPAYMADVGPAIQAEIQKAFQGMPQSER